MDRHTGRAWQALRRKYPIPETDRLSWLVDFAQRGARPMRWRAMKLRIGTLRTHVREVAVWRKGSGRDVNPFHIPLRGEADHKSLADKVALIRRTIRTVLRQH